MLSERLKQAFLLLLRQGLWEKKEEATPLFPLSLSDWKAIYEMAVKQTVQGIVYDGIRLLIPSNQPPRDLLIQWTVGIDKLERLNRQQHTLMAILPQIFKQEPAIPFQVLKGQSTAVFYPNPLHRVCGDIDLYFGNAEQTEKANQRIEQLGIPVKRGKLGDSSYLLNGIEMEHHQRLIDLYRPTIRKEIRHWETEEFKKSKGIPTPIANHLLQSTHILKHQLMQGIGLRQFCDLAMTMKAQKDFIDSEELKKICQKWKLYSWHQVIYSLLIHYLGYPEQDLPFSAHVNPQPLMDEVWLAGNFGHGDDRFGERPSGYWQGKVHTLKVILNKWKLSFRYAPLEICWFLTDLAWKRIKELFIHDS